MEYLNFLEEREFLSFSICVGETDKYLVCEAKRKFSKMREDPFCRFFALPNGTRHGKYFNLCEKGDGIFDEFEYVDGIRHGKYIKWHLNGMEAKKKVMIESNYVDGLIQGKCFCWYKNGNPRREMNYVDGKNNGECLEWCEDGQLSSKCNYVDDILCGKIYIWDSRKNIWYEGV